VNGLPVSGGRKEFAFQLRRLQGIYLTFRRGLQLHGDRLPREDKWMKNIIVILAILFFWTLAFPALAQQTRPLPIYPQSRQNSTQDACDTEMAHKLYDLARHENPRLRWDGCLAAKAILRARRMVQRGYFDHEDPQTGKNPVWESVSQCVPLNRKNYKASAGENLSKGVDTPANIHRAFMKSPTHRKNILDPRFNHIGVGCYESICVELFLGL
jgi:uncharacterized protein YkwD